MDLRDASASKKVLEKFPNNPFFLLNAYLKSLYFHDSSISIKVSYIVGKRRTKTKTKTGENF